ncbi:MAG: DoxX family protein [Candidatus Magasanikbacteria bacterium]
MLTYIAQKYKTKFYFIFRVLIGLMFLQHGLQKVFGLLGGNQVNLFSFIGLAGIIELVVGTAITLGVLVRVSALLGAFEMIVAWFTAHFTLTSFSGWIPIMNGGEKAILFLASFLVLFVYGSMKKGSE